MMAPEAGGAGTPATLTQPWSNPAALQASPLLSEPTPPISFRFKPPARASTVASGLRRPIRTTPHILGRTPRPRPGKNKRRQKIVRGREAVVSTVRREGRCSSGPPHAQVPRRPWSRRCLGSSTGRSSRRAWDSLSLCHTRNPIRRQGQRAPSAGAAGASFQRTAHAPTRSRPETVHVRLPPGCAGSPMTTSALRRISEEASA